MCLYFVVRCAIAAASINDGYFFEAACDKKMFRLSFAQKSGGSQLQKSEEILENIRDL